MHLSYTFHFYYACLFCVFHIIVQLCVFSACWFTLGPFMLLPASALAPRGPRGFFAGICWQINAAGLANSSHSGWHQPRCTLNTKRWPWALFSLFCFPQMCAHTHNICTRTQCDIVQNYEFQMSQKKPQIHPKIWIKTLISNSRGSDLTRSRIWLLAIAQFLIAISLLTFSLSHSLSLSL